jgi:hypothetical protein
LNFAKQHQKYLSNKTTFDKVSREVYTDIIQVQLKLVLLEHADQKEQQQPKY